MYKTVITLKDNISVNALPSIRAIIVNAFNNRAGKLSDVSNDPNVFIFEGNETEYACLDLGMLSLQNNAVLNNIKSMMWVDEEPEESCDMLEVFARHAR